jgi:hypothetical protein
MLTQKLAITVFTFATSLASHAGIIYDEGVAGDLKVFSPVSLSFQNGNNTVRGSSREIDYQGGASADYDGFLFTLGAGQVLNSVTFNILGYELASPQTTGLRTHFTLYEDHYLGTPLLAKWINVLSAAPQLFLDNDALVTPGLYSFGTTGFGISSQQGASTIGGLWNYEITFNVSNVPEPGALSLAVLGLLAAGMTQLRKRSNAG